jgi:hypothetical protein
MNAEAPAPGSVRYFREDGECIVTSPRDPLYSTALMCASEYWSETSGTWVSVLGSEPEAMSDGK